jgi:transcriptional regulator with PAS, ATPase and Fis domain
LPRIGVPLEIVKSGRTLGDLEKMAIESALRKHGGNRSAAAKELGIDVSTLFRKSKSQGISLPEKDGRHRRG